jgi:hypothetical protein
MNTVVNTVLTYYNVIGQRNAKARRSVKTNAGHHNLYQQEHKR